MGVSADLLEAVDTIKAEIRRVAEMIDEFVDAPVPAARPRARVPVSVLCSRAIELIARDAAAAGIEVGADISEFGASDVLLEVDMSEMLEVLSQLLQQAVEAALAGGGKVLLRARRESDSAVIEVRHDQRALSTPVPILRSLMPSSRNELPVQSLGNLNVALKVVAEHGGTIEVDSEPGRTEFRVKLPIGAAQQRAL
jgi:signal transduction histidine kinase